MSQILLPIVTQVPIDQVQLGDRLLIKPGEKIPTDGIILSGEAVVQ